jgi:hypothetical protein
MIDRSALILLLAGCIALAGVLASELTAAPTPETEAATGAGTLHVAQQSPAALPEPGPRPEAVVAEILARPLFSSTRRPPAQGGGPASDSGLSDTRLTGIVTAPGHRFAIFAPTGGKPLIVSEGDTVSGWRVENITPREVSLSGPEGTKTLEPKIDPNLLPPPPPPGSTPPPASLTPRPVPIRPAAASPARPGLPPSFPNRAPLRPGARRARE